MLQTLAMSLPLLVSLQGAPPQGTAPEGAAPPAARGTQSTQATREPGQWERLNGVSLVVNQECLTRIDLDREILRRLQDPTVKLSSLDEHKALEQEVAREQITFLLKVQAGRAMGFDPEQVRMSALREHERKLEQVGSVSMMADFLRRAEIDSARYREDTESQIYRQLWEGAVEGHYPGPGGRVFVDRYVRPGRLWHEYEVAASETTDGGEVVVQQMSVAIQRGGSPGDSEALAEALRERVLAGEDFGKLVEEYELSSRGGDGTLSPIPIDKLDELPMRELADFLRDAPVGQVSEVMPVELNGELRGFMVAKLLERRTGDIGPFHDREVQQRLIQALERARSEQRRESAIDRLFEGAYVWSPTGARP